MPPVRNSVGGHGKSGVRGERQEVLAGTKTPHWACGMCGELHNWASRVVCRGCRRDAPGHVLHRALAAADRVVAQPGRSRGGGASGAGDKVQAAVAAAEKKAKAAEARAELERKARLAAEAEVAKARAMAADPEEEPGDLSADQVARQKALRAELKELRSISPTLHARLFGGAGGHMAAVQAVQDELAALAAAKRNGLPLADQLASQQRFVDACVKADAAAQAKLDTLLAQQVELEAQVRSCQETRAKAADKRAAAETQLSELHARMAQASVPAAAAITRAPGITEADTLLFQGILAHVDPAVIQASCQAAGGESVEQVSARASLLAEKLKAAAAAGGAPVSVSGSAADASAESGPQVVGEEALTMELDEEGHRQLESIVAELDAAGSDGGEGAASRADIKKRLVQRAASLVGSKHLKAKKKGA